MASPVRNRFAVAVLVVSATIFTLQFSTPSRAQSKRDVSQAAASPSGIPLHGAKLVELYCAGCHGVDGNSTDTRFPKLAGQKASYIRMRLRTFKTSSHAPQLMAGPASALSAAQIDELAKYFSNQSVKPDVVKDTQLERVGEGIYYYGRQGTPACAACHNPNGYGAMGPMMGGRGMMGPGMMGPGMMGNIESVPFLNGQHAAYTIKQLDAFATGARRGTVMGRIASGLRKLERKAVAEYLAALK